MENEFVGDYHKFKNRKEEHDDIKREKITFFFLFLIFVFILEMFLKRPLNYLSLLILSNLNSQGQYCFIIDKLLYLQNYFGKLLLIIIITNFKSVFAALIYILLTESMIFFNGILKLMYIDPRPFWEVDLVPCRCTVSYGNPSIIASDITMMYLALYRIFYKKENEISNKLFLFTANLVILIISVSAFLENINSINQIIFGICLSYALYFLVFEVFEIHPEWIPMFKVIIVKQKIIQVISYLLGIYLFVNLIHYSYEISHNHNENYSETWFNNILKHCLYIPYLFFDSVSYHSAIFLPISVFISIYLEYSLVFHKNYNKFLCFNADSKLKMKWNDTSLFKTCMRILITFGIVNLINYFCMIGDITNDSFLKLIFFRYIVFNILAGIFIFFVGKFVFIFFNLANDAVFTETNEFFFSNYESLYIEKLEEEEKKKLSEIEEEEDEEEYFKKVVKK